MEMPLRIEAQPAASNDGRVLALVLGPGLLIAGLFYFGGATELALWIAGAFFVVSVLLSPEVGFYVFFAEQALDQMLLESVEAILTPGKIIGPFILLAYFLQPGRVRTPMLVSRPFVITMLLFGAWGLVTMVWSMFPLAALRYAGQVVVQVLLIVVAIHRLSDRVQIGRALQFAVLGATIAALIIVTGHGGSSRYMRATLSEFYDCNAAALGMAIGLLAVPGAWYCTRQNWLRLAMLGVAPVILVAIVMTGSRTGVVVAVLAPLLSLLFVRRVGMLQRIAIPAVCVLVGVLAMRYAMQSVRLTEQTEERLQELVEGRIDIAHEPRFMIYYNGIMVYLSQPWGFGYGNSRMVIGEKTGVDKVIHDNFASALVEGGPVGLLLFVYGLWLAFRRVRGAKQGVLGVSAMIVFMLVILSSFTLQTYASKYFWIPLTFSLLLAEQARREELRQLRPAVRPPTAADVLRGLGPADAVVY